MADTKKYDPQHDYEPDAFEIFDPIIDEVNDILDSKTVPAYCASTNSYLYYLASKYDRCDPPEFYHLPEVEEARQLLEGRLKQTTEDQWQILQWYTRQNMRGRYSFPAVFAGLYDHWLSSLILWKEEFEQEGLMLSALAQQHKSRHKN